MNPKNRTITCKRNEAPMLTLSFGLAGLLSVSAGFTCIARFIWKDTLSIFYTSVDSMNRDWRQKQGVGYWKPLNRPECGPWSKKWVQGESCFCVHSGWWGEEKVVRGQGRALGAGQQKRGADGSNLVSRLYLIVSFGTGKRCAVSSSTNQRHPTNYSRNGQFRREHDDYDVISSGSIRGPFSGSNIKK